MKKIIYIVSFLFFSVSYASAQNSVINRMIIPGKLSLLSFEKNKNKTPAGSVKKLISMPEQGNNFNSFISDLPVIKLKEIFNKKNTLLITEFSFSDMLENTFNSFNADLINKYDDSTPELFKDAPSLFKLKCIIRL